MRNAQDHKKSRKNISGSEKRARGEKRFRTVGRGRLSPRVSQGLYIGSAGRGDEEPCRVSNTSIGAGSASKRGEKGYKWF